MFRVCLAAYLIASAASVPDCPDGTSDGNETRRTFDDVRIKLGQFLPGAESIRSGLAYLSELDSGDDGRGSEGGGKKGSGILMMATMMGGTMAALGFGALGMLAMKALTVSAMALTLSVIMGLKKLMSKHEHESGHIVSYVPVHHGVRRRRYLEPEIARLRLDT